MIRSAVSLRTRKSKAMEQQAVPQCVDVTVAYAHASAMWSARRIKCPKFGRNRIWVQKLGQKLQNRHLYSLAYVPSPSTRHWHVYMVIKLCYPCSSHLYVLISCTFTLAFQGGVPRRRERVKGRQSAPGSRSPGGMQYRDLLACFLIRRHSSIENHMMF